MSRLTQGLWAVALAAACVASAPAQTSPALHDVVPVAHDSGTLRFTPAHEPRVLWSALVAADGAAWLRVVFSDATVLPTGTRLRITALHDGAEQYLDERSLAQWRSRSAYFNGDAALVELIAAPHAAGAARVHVSAVWSGAPAAPDTESLCGAADDRLPSTDPRVGRLVPAGCTGFLIDDCARCALTAGHCTAGVDTMQFNVPLSNIFGGWVFPPPEHQYAIDPASVQSTGGAGAGNDYAHFGVFPNSNTGKHPADAQGAVVPITNAPPAAGAALRITGYGTTGATVSPTWNLAQKSLVGPAVAPSGPTLAYVTDTTVGNSGSPVIDELTGRALGIHTHAGCATDGTGSNKGAWIGQQGVQALIANPRGVCACAPCPADFDDDGDADANDFFAFLNAYNRGRSRADFNNDGLINADDFFAFLDAYQAGC